MISHLKKKKQKQLNKKNTRKANHIKTHFCWLQFEPIYDLLALGIFKVWWSTVIEVEGDLQQPDIPR